MWSVQGGATGFQSLPEVHSGLQVGKSTMDFDETVGARDRPAGRSRS
jgi:hypothetical protein